MLGSRVLHADETPIALLDPGRGKTKKAYMWAYARGAFDPEPGVVYDFCPGRGGQYPREFLTGWSGTLVRDEFSGYESVVALEGRVAAGCLAHARRKFVAALEAGDVQQAAQRMLAHIGSVEDALGESMRSQADTRERLRATLAPVARPKLRAVR